MAKFKKGLGTFLFMSGLLVMTFVSGGLFGEVDYSYTRIDALCSMGVVFGLFFWGFWAGKLKK